MKSSLTRNNSLQRGPDGPDGQTARLPSPVPPSREHRRHSRLRSYDPAVLTLAALGLLAPSAKASCPSVPGDLDGNGFTSVVDVQCGLLILLWELGGQTGATPMCAAGGPEALDVNCSGNGDLVDVTLLINWALAIPLSPLVDANGNGCPDSCEQDEEAVIVQFFGDETFTNGPLSIQSAQAIWASQGLVITAQSWPASADHEATLYWRQAGTAGDFAPLAMSLESTSAGPFATNALWRAEIDTPALDSMAAGGLELYLQVADGDNVIYLSNNSLNYQFPINPSTTAQPIQFAGDRTFYHAGLPRAPGQDVIAGLDLTVTLQTWPPSLDHEAVLYFTTNNYDTIQSVTMDFERAGAGQFGNNFEWSGAIPGSALPPGATLIAWMSATNGADTLWDSNGGANFSFPVKAPNELVQVGYSRAGKSTFSKCHWDGENCMTGWKYSPGMASPMVASYSQYQVYGAWTHPGVEVYVAGVSDAAPGNPFAIFAVEQLLRVRVSSPLFGGAPTAAQEQRALGIAGKFGNNFIYQWVFFGTGCSCPVGFAWPALGLYDYRYEVSVDGGQSWSELNLDSGDGQVLPLQIDWQLGQTPN